MPSRPTYRAFYEPDGVTFYEINPDGTPGNPLTMRDMAPIVALFADAIAAGDYWVADFYAALHKNGKANLRGSQ